MSPHPPVGAHYHHFVLRRIFPGLFFLMASASLGAFRENFRLEKIRKEKETEHLRTELSFLRAQVNPHFMLNVLNSMALLARRKSDLLEPVLMELAGLMNYMLYEANNEKIRLEDEIIYLRAYIDLQMLRFGDDVTVQFTIPEQIKNKHIEPMLLIPLVENAFKHGIGLVNSPVITIDIEIGKEEDRLSMTVKNKYNPLIKLQENKPPGIGLKNLKKRLELIYPGEFELNSMGNFNANEITTESWYMITLNIPLQ
jgi:LytS/YehU family sensor histidine kinase